ncbi:MAG: peptide ABC transporter substrate-binding protein, partial [Anaerolineae bacterium]|nr:peptide ABC transporter substrate-binding protein [Anaerolineae bacterium]
MNSFKRRMVLVSVVLALVLGIGSVVSAQGDTLNILYWQAISTMNPFLSGGTKDLHGGSLVLEPLARYDENGGIVPYLVDEIPTVDNGGVSEDLLSITWKLKEGLVWSDGTPVTAEDAVFSWQYCTDPATGCSQITNFTDVTNVEAVDDLTVKVTFGVPKPYPYGPFVGSTSVILQKAQFADCVGAAAQTCTDQNFYPIGTGPYVVDEFRANDVVTLSANPNYREEGKPYFQHVVLKGGGDAESAARAVLETGEADYAWNLQVAPEILASMEAAGNGSILVAFSTGVERIHINQTNPDPALGDMRSVWAEDG